MNSFSHLIVKYKSVNSNSCKSLVMMALVGPDAQQLTLDLPWFNGTDMLLDVIPSVLSDRGEKEGPLVMLELPTFSHKKTFEMRNETPHECSWPFYFSLLQGGRKKFENLAENARWFIYKNATKYNFVESLLVCLKHAEASETPDPEVVVHAFKNCNL